MSYRPHWSWAAGMLLLLTGVPPVQAQTTTAPVATDSFLALVPPREIVDIDRDIAAAEADRSSAAREEESALALKSGSDARIQVKKREISAADGRKNLAKREKKEAEVAALEAEKNALEREKNLMERRKSLREAEIDLAKKRAELATLTRQALDLEKQLMLKRAEHGGIASGGPQAARSNQILFDLEKATLEAQRKRADKAGEVTDREKRVVERRMQILEAQRSVVSGR
jgi:hypothetical protein